MNERYETYDDEMEIDLIDFSFLSVAQMEKPGGNDSAGSSPWKCLLCGQNNKICQCCSGRLSAGCQTQKQI